MGTSVVMLAPQKSLLFVRGPFHHEGASFSFIQLQCTMKHNGNQSRRKDFGEHKACCAYPCRGEKNS